MRPFSRWMPEERPPKVSVFEWLIGWLLFVPGLLFLALCIAVLWPFLLFGHYHRNHRLRRLLADRAGEDIGTFARAFDRRKQPFDPWVVRATWDALVPCRACGGRLVPLRPTDRLLEDLGFDLDDFDCINIGIIEVIANRSGHSLDNIENNPQWGHIETVEDLVRLITLQPRAPEEGPARRDARPA